MGPGGEPLGWDGEFANDGSRIACGGSRVDEDDDVENDEAEVTTAAEVGGSVGGVVSTSIASSQDEVSEDGEVRCSTSLEGGDGWDIGSK